MDSRLYDLRFDSGAMIIIKLDERYLENRLNKADFACDGGWTVIFMGGTKCSRKMVHLDLYPRTLPWTIFFSFLIVTKFPRHFSLFSCMGAQNL